MSFTLALILVAATIVAMTVIRLRSKPPKATVTASQSGLVRRTGMPVQAPVDHPDATRCLSAEQPRSLVLGESISTDSIPADQRDILLQELRGLPRPPLSLHQLVSPAFLDGASSGAISDLIMGDAQIAAKVLALVNSPFYGLSKPVMSVGQAVTFLGLNSIRTICLNYMLEASFPTLSPERKQTFNTIMKASTLAGELCNHLSHRLDLPERGSLSTQVVLSFLGHLAATALMPSESHLWIPEFGLIERAQAEQKTLGLTANQLGTLLMQEWGLPAILIHQVACIDRYCSPCIAHSPGQDNGRLAYGYLCARLGEKLALESVTDLSSYDLVDDNSADLRTFGSHIDATQLALLNGILRSVGMRNALERITAANRHTHAG